MNVTIVQRKYRRCCKGCGCEVSEKDLKCHTGGCRYSVERKPTRKRKSPSAFNAYEIELRPKRGERGVRVKKEPSAKSELISAALLFVARHTDGKGCNVRLDTENCGSTERLVNAARAYARSLSRRKAAR